MQICFMQKLPERIKKKNIWLIWKLELKQLRINVD